LWTEASSVRSEQAPAPSNKTSRLQRRLSLHLVTKSSQQEVNFMARVLGPVAPVTHHRTAKVDGLDIFYREAGPHDVPVVLLLHGFPTSSHMFRNLLPALADRYRVIAPDYPGFGQSEMPDRSTFAYTFDRFAEIVDALLDQLGITRFAMYVM